MADDQRKKKRGRSKLFKSCFKSFNAKEGVSDDRNIHSGRIQKPVLIAVSARKGNDFIPDVNLVTADADAGDCYAKRRHPRRRVSRILKAVWFDSMMKKKKKIRRSSSKSSIASDTSSSSSEKNGKSCYDSNACSTECTDMDDSCSRRSNLLSSSSRATSSYSTSSSSSSSVNSNSRWSSDQKQSSQTDSVDSNKPAVSSNSSILKKPNPITSSNRSCIDQNQNQKQSSKTDSLNLRRQNSSISLPLARPKSTNSISKSSSYPKGLSGLDSNNNSLSSNSPNPDWNLRWCLFILLSFVVLVFWGRIFSILCTSIWFYFVPSRGRIKRVNSVAKSTDFQDLDSVQYKKRVIMAGFLDRTRNPIR